MDSASRSVLWTWLRSPQVVLYRCCTTTYDNPPFSLAYRDILTGNCREGGCRGGGPETPSRSRSAGLAEGVRGAAEAAGARALPERPEATRGGTSRGDHNRHTNWESHGGLPNHQAPSDPYICAMNLQNLFGCHEILQLRGS